MTTATMVNAATSSVTAIEAKSVCLSFDGKTLFDQMSFAVEAGEFICLLGETGCGKSTLLRLILGEEKATSGELITANNAHKGVNRMCGYVPQKYSLFPDRTVLGNLVFGPERVQPRSKRPEIRADAFEWLERIGLQKTDAAKYPHQLSGGMQQRVAIAQALLMKPAILLMDEAFSALDPNTRSGMQSLIHDLWLQTGTTIVFVTHNTHEAACLASRLLVLAREVGKPSRIVLDERVGYAREDLKSRRERSEVLDLVRRIELHSGGAFAGS